ncbi:MAG: hypothetical protein OCC45_09385 [Desulfotalea sp.]
MSNVRLLFGVEFWDFLEKSIQVAQKHVFIFSAYAKKQDMKNLVSKIPTNTPYLVITRDDIDKIDVNNIVYADKNKFHAKIYIIDDTIIIGSQNLYKVVSIPLKDKTGEISVAFTTSDSVNIIYQSLMIVLKEEYEEYFRNKLNLITMKYEENEENIDLKDVWISFFREYKLESFLNINSCNCPSCGSKVNFKENDYCIIYCQGYNENISADECGHGNACKYCYGDKEIIEPNLMYSCTKCNFEIGYITEESVKGPYYSWDTLSLFSNTEELENFLKLYFFLIDIVGEFEANNLLTSLGVIGNLSQLDLNKRYYEIESLLD